MNRITLDIIEEFSLPIPIPYSVRETLHQQIMLCTDVALDKRTTALNNMLSVWAVNYYLQILCGIPTSLRSSESFNPIFALLDDTADLEFPDLGRLECRPVKPGETVCLVPETACRDRIGYVVVRIEPSLREATILGFTPTVANGSIQLISLQPPEALLEDLEALKVSTSQVITQTTGEPAIGNNVQQLRDWFNQHFQVAIAQGWETVEAIRQQIQRDLQPIEVYLSNTPENLSSDPAATSPIIQLLQTSSDPLTQYSAIQILGEIGIGSPEVVQTLTQFLDVTQNDDLRWQAALSLQKIAPHHPKAAVSRAKLINLGVQLANQQVALIGTLVPKDDISTSLFFQVHSFNRQQPLPAGLQLSILDNSQTVLQSVTTRSDEQGHGIDESIQLLCHLSSHCTFCVRVEIADVTFDQYFAV